MSQADKIREFAFREYIDPARKAGLREVILRAGDIHHKMGLTARLPAICGALGTKKFEKEFRLILIKREGTTNGANVYFSYLIE